MHWRFYIYPIVILLKCIGGFTWISDQQQWSFNHGIHWKMDFQFSSAFVYVCRFPTLCLDQCINIVNTIDLIQSVAIIYSQVSTDSYRGGIDIKDKRVVSCILLSTLFLWSIKTTSCLNHFSYPFWTPSYFLW